MKQPFTALLFELQRQLVLQEIDVQGGLEAAKDAALSEIKPIINGIVLPIICTVLGVMLVCTIATANSQRKQGQEFGDKLKSIAILIVVLIVVGSSYLWLWQMVGV